MFPRLSSHSGGGYNADSMAGVMNYENPAFKVKIVPPDDSLTPKPKEAEEERDNDAADKFTVGDCVVGKEVKSDESCTGQIVSITKNAMGDGMVLVILDDNERKRYIDATTASKKENHGGRPDDDIQHEEV